MARQFAHINSAMLVWARTKSGREPAHVAAYLKVPLERYLAWETGDELPTLPKMRIIARLLKRPLALFYLSEPPQGFSPIHDYRTLPGSPTAPQSPELLLAIRRAHFHRSIAIEIAEELEVEIASPDFAVGGAAGSASEFATQLRAWLGVSMDDQLSWKTPYEAKQAWQDRIETHGVLVFQAEGVSTDEMRGFCISDRPFPVVVTNGSDTPNARIFTMVHELCHVLQSQAGICTPWSVDASNTGEVFCNRVAGETLVPPVALAADARATGPEDWTDAELGRLANRFSVSREVVLRRLLDMGWTTPEFYHAGRERFAREWAMSKARRSTDREIKRDMARLAKSNLGPSFVRLVLSAMHTDRITSRDASDYLGLKSKHFGRLEEMVWQ